MHSYRKPDFLLMQYTSIRVIPFWKKKKGLCSRSTLRWFLGCKVACNACSSSRRWKHNWSLHNVLKCQFYSGIDPHQTKTTATQIHLTSEEAWKETPDFLKSSWQHTNFSSPKRTTALLDTGNLTITVYLKEQKILVLLFETTSLTYSTLREMQHAIGITECAKYALMIYWRNFCLPFPKTVPTIKNK